MHPIEIFRKLIRRKVILHGIFWTSILIIVFISENWEHQENMKFGFFAHYLIAFAVFISVSYSNIYLLVPKFFKEKKYILYAFYLSLLMIIGASITVLAQVISYYFGLSIELSIKNHGHNLIYYFFHVMFGELMFLIATTLFLIMDEWIKFQDITIKLKETERQKVQSELQALKAQINPHFLFNTLNNIYSHSLEKSPKTPEMILKLSELMSYILYECQDVFVPLKNELHFIQNYIELEKLRYEDHILVNFEITGELTNRQIAPLVFIAFIENGFKHIGNKGNEKPFINIKIDVGFEKICLRVINSRDAETKKFLTKESGVGVENVKKRLELIYPNQHKLIITEIEDRYDISLDIFEKQN
jgi:sensor histidine kinase YesM